MNKGLWFSYQYLHNVDKLFQNGIINFEQYTNLREQIDAGLIPDTDDEDDSEDEDDFEDEDDSEDEDDDGLFGDEDEVLESEQRTKLESLFKISFKSVINVENIVVKNKQSKVYYFSPASNGFTNVGAFYYLVEVGVKNPRYFALECSYDQQYVLCEWVFENGEKKRCHWCCQYG